MTKPVFLVLFAFICVGSFWGCSKDANNYSTADHTAQVIIPRSWKGTVNGYYKGDTTIPPDTTHYEWAKIYNRVISDSTIVISKIDGYTVSALGITLGFRLTDSVNKTMRFDSVISGSLNCILFYNYVKDSMSLECHTVSGTNPLSGQYYQANFFLHTH